VRDLPATLQPFVVETDLDGVRMAFRGERGNRVVERGCILVLFGPALAGLGPGLAAGGLWSLAWLLEVAQLTVLNVMLVWEYLFPLSLVATVFAGLAWLTGRGKGFELALRGQQLTLRHGRGEWTAPVHDVGLSIAGGRTTFRMGGELVEVRVAQETAESIERLVWRARARSGTTADIPDELRSLRGDRVRHREGAS